eukprot:CAMPEP_0201589020 /NCGR_PEP_ID=MMETSP0190_2-20130828/161876_1 /ASSEMBLY_ACC=CAM_ASM_000263 /TAXON_ID=37353 /ORGANISM="Rosalina sp." /LENGTH=65 /DNA_ID=CAMNT_0048042351 /DNA_START=364 /DNA_END=558 /DNA_ORIENTATION=-
MTEQERKDIKPEQFETEFDKYYYLKYLQQLQEKDEEEDEDGDGAVLEINFQNDSQDDDTMNVDVD